MNILLKLFCVNLFYIANCFSEFLQPPNIFSILPKEICDNKFLQSEKEFQKRWEKLFNYEFSKWERNKPRKEIIDEFTRIINFRSNTWYLEPKSDILESSKDYLISQELLINHRYREPNCIAFEYNNTDSSYNSSNITIFFSFISFIKNISKQLLKVNQIKYGEEKYYSFSLYRAIFDEICNLFSPTINEHLNYLYNLDAIVV